MFDAEMQAQSEQLLQALRDAKLKIATAESCTGGLIAGLLTEIAGSSDVVERGYVTYSNEAKQESLGVPLEIIETFGAVSIACAWAMAKGALERSHANIAVAISGVAGPDGGTDLKPVGTVVFARVVRGTESEPEGELKLFEPISRASIRREATLCALDLLLP